MNELEKRYAEFRTTVPNPPTDPMRFDERQNRERSTKHATIDADVAARRRDTFRQAKPRALNQPLFTCPRCGRAGFTKSGIKTHRCPELPRRPNGMRSRLDLEEALKVTGEL